MIALSAASAMAVPPMFGADHTIDGAESVREANESEIKELRGKADVPGRIIFPSPDGRYGFNQADEKEAEEAGKRAIPNCLVDLKTMKRVVDVQKFGDVEMAKEPCMRVRWRSDSKAALFTAPTSPSTSSYLLIVIGKDGKAAVHDLGEEVREAALSGLAEEWPALRQHLKLPESASWESEELNMTFGFSKDGKEIDPAGHLVAVAGTLTTNPQGSEGLARVTIGFTGKATVATGKFSRTAFWSEEAGIQAFDWRNEPVLLNRLSLHRMREEAVKEGRLFGMDDPTGMMDVYELEQTEATPLAKKRGENSATLVFASPDGRYAFSRPTTEQAEKSNYEVSNHLVDLQTMKPVEEIETGGGGDFERRNHGGMRVRWRPDSRAALFLAEAKWEPSAFSVIMIEDSGKLRQIHIDALLRAELVSQLKHRWSAISEKLKLSAEDKYDGESGPWSTEYFRYGAEFTADGKAVRVKGRMETNGKRMEGQVAAAIVTEGIIDLANGKFTPADSRVIQAGVVTYDDESREVLKPKIIFPVTQKKKK